MQIGLIKSSSCQKEEEEEKKGRERCAVSFQLLKLIGIKLGRWRKREKGEEEDEEEEEESPHVSTALYEGPPAV